MRCWTTIYRDCSIPPPGENSGIEGRSDRVLAFHSRGDCTALLNTKAGNKKGPTMEDHCLLDLLMT